MWERSMLKARAKERLKISYWKLVVTGLVLCLITYGCNTFTWKQGVSSEDGAAAAAAVASLNLAAVLAFLMIMLGVLVVALIISTLLGIFVWNPIEVGCKKIFAENTQQDPQLGDMLFAFKNNYGNICKTMFLRGLFTFLWTMLLVVPGMIKAYEYMMVPYLLGDDPDMSSGEAFARSKEMMAGNKWNAFVLDLSFIGWFILDACTMGIAGIFFVFPYVSLTRGELYRELLNEH